MRIYRAAFAIGLLAAGLMGCSGVPPTNLGVRNGKLAACPSSPNCVSSQAADAKHRIDSITYDSALPVAMARLKQVIAHMKRARIVSQSDDYLRVEFTSRVMRFVDDAEFYFDDHSKHIEMRSAARLGYYDFGVNRRRMQVIRRQFVAAQSEAAQHH